MAAFFWHYLDMTLPATPSEIYELLAADEALGDSLGTYVFPDGTTASAMAAYGANETSPPGTQTIGVEVVIAQEVEQRPTLFVTGGGQSIQTWRLYVTQYENQGSRHLQEAVNRVVTLLPGAYGIPVNIPTGPANGIGVLSQIVITWKNPEGQLLYTIQEVAPPQPPEPEDGDVDGLTLIAGLYKKKYEGYFYDQDTFFEPKLVSWFDFDDISTDPFYQIANTGGAGVTQQDWIGWGFIPQSQYDSPDALPLPFPSPGKGVFYDLSTPYPSSGSASVSRPLLLEEVTSVIDDSYSQAAGQNNKSLIIKGYFKPSATGTYKFRLYSDDASYFWLGQNAYDGNRTMINSVASLPGIHGPSYSQEGIFTMTANSYYPLTVEFGNGPEGEGVLIFEYMPPNSEEWTSDLAGKVFHDANVKGHVNQQL